MMRKVSLESERERLQQDEVSRHASWNLLNQYLFERVVRSISNVHR